MGKTSIALAGLLFLAVGGFAQTIPAQASISQATNMVSQDAFMSPARMADFWNDIGIPYVLANGGGVATNLGALGNTTVATMTNSANQFTGTFNGNGAGITNVTGTGGGGLANGSSVTNLTIWDTSSNPISTTWNVNGIVRTNTTNGANFTLMSTTLTMGNSNNVVQSQFGNSSTGAVISTIWNSTTNTLNVTTNAVSTSNTPLATMSSGGYTYSVLLGMGTGTPTVSTNISTFLPNSVTIPGWTNTPQPATITNVTLVLEAGSTDSHGYLRIYSGPGTQLPQYSTLGVITLSTNYPTPGFWTFAYAGVSNMTSLSYVIPPSMMDCTSSNVLLRHGSILSASSMVRFAYTHTQ